MKLAISNIAWTAEEDSLAAEVLGAGRIAGVEIAPSVIWPNPTAVSNAEADRYRDWWAERQISIVALQSLLFGRPQLTLFESSAARIATLEYLDSIFRLAGWLGAGPLVFGSPKNRLAGALEPAERDRIAIAFFRDAADRASDHGVTLCLEPNPPQYGCDFVTGAAEAAALADRVDRSGFGIHLDAAAIGLVGDDVATSIAAVHPWLRHFHASEPFLVPLGTGGVDHPSCAAALAAAGYRHWVSVEMRRRPETDRRLELERTVALLTTSYGVPTE